MFLFYEPNIDDALSIYGAFSTLDELKQAVDLTKRGTDAKIDYREPYETLSYSNVYKERVRTAYCSYF